ncbi:MAG: DUF6599 family protein [Polyangiales bacterium]
MRFPFPLRRCAALLLLSTPLVSIAACKDDGKSSPTQGTPPPPSGASVAGSGGASSACDPSQVAITDPKTAAIVPPTIAGFCARKSEPVQAYGDGSGKDVKDISDAIDGAGDLYVNNFFARRFEIVKFVDPKGTQAAVEVWISSYDKPESAYALFTYRAIANVDPDPAVAAAAKRRPTRAIPGGGAAALGNAQAFLWKGNVLVELTYNADPSSSLEKATAEADVLLPLFVQAIGDKIVGSLDLPLDVRLLPTEAEGRLPLGVDYVPSKYARPEGKGDAFKLSVAGGYATAYLKEGIKRARVLAYARDDIDSARDAMAVFQKLPGALILKEKDLGDDSVHFSFAIGSGGPGAEGKAEGIAVRKGRIVLAIIDEEFALGDPAKKDAYPRYTKEEKIAKLRALLAKRNGPPPPPPTPSDSAEPRKPPPSGSAGAP